MQDSKPQQPQPAAARPAPGSLEDLNVTAPHTADAAGGEDTEDARRQPEKDANNRDRLGLENQSVTKPAPVDVERRR